MDEIPTLPPPILLKIAGYAHLAEMNDFGVQATLPRTRWFQYSFHKRNVRWCAIKLPLYVWCNCSSACYGEKTRHTNDLTAMTYTKTTTWRNKQLVEIYAIVPLE